jgi:hypothetical protein
MVGVLYISKACESIKKKKKRPTPRTQGQQRAVNRPTADKEKEKTSKTPCKSIPMH